MLVVRGLIVRGKCDINSQEMSSISIIFFFRSLFEREPGSLLARMLRGCTGPVDVAEDGTFLIDRSPDYFKPILNYFRTGKVIVDPDVSLQGVFEEARFYLVQSMVSTISKLPEFQLQSRRKSTSCNHHGENSLWCN